MTLKPVWNRPSDRPVRTAASEEDSATVWDVIVVGAGLSGVTTALLLARAGRTVLVLEARELGAGTTGSSTAKVSLLQGTTLSTLRRRTSPRVAGAYVAGNLEGQAWLERYAEEHAVAFQRRTAYTFATSASGARSAREELDAAQQAGLPATWVTETALPFPVTAAVALTDQLQVDPMELLVSLAGEAVAHGARIREGVTAGGVSGDDPVVVTTDGGDFRADRVVPTPWRTPPRNLRWTACTSVRTARPDRCAMLPPRTAPCCSSAATATSPAGPPRRPHDWPS